MKLALAALALLAAAPAAAQSMPGMASQPPAASQPAATAEAVGQIKAVDLRAGTVTIHHGPIAAIGWPAMTMTFKASPTALSRAKVGQTVRFTLQTADNQVVAITPQ